MKKVLALLALKTGRFENIFGECSGLLDGNLVGNYFKFSNNFNGCKTSICNDIHTGRKSNFFGWLSSGDISRIAPESMGSKWIERIKMSTPQFGEFFFKLKNINEFNSHTWQHCRYIDWVLNYKMREASSAFFQEIGAT